MCKESNQDAAEDLRLQPAQTYVLVHGAWHGAWCWSRLVAELRNDGHEVFTPTFTGSGERVHLANPQVNLDTLVEDVVQTIEVEELQQVVLVGHSFGGMVITGAAHRAPERIGKLVYLDAAVPEPGESFFQAIGFQPPPGRVPEGAWRLAPQAAGCDSVGVGLTDPEDRAWVDRRLTPQPVGTFAQPISFDWARLAGIGKVYIRSLRPWFAQTAFAVFRQRATRNGWATYDIDAGHDSMVSSPKELAALLRTVAAA